MRGTLIHNCNYFLRSRSPAIFGVCIAAATTTMQLCGIVWLKITTNSDSNVRQKNMNKQTDL